MKGLSKGKAVVFFVKWPVFGWTLSFSFALQRNTEVRVCGAGWQGRRMAFMVLLRRDISETLHANLLFLSACLSSSLSFAILKCHILYLPFLPSPLILPFFLRPSAPENVYFHGFKYAHSELGVNHHFVFITCSLSRLSRCARGMRNWGVRKYSCCFWLQSSVFQ